jgi:AcrR family transcriptional regulator
VSGTRQVPDRSRQKARTHRAIVEAAAAMIRGGQQPTVAQAAEAAGVHRATAYRYFPTPESLLVEATLSATGPPIAELVADVPADDPFALLDVVVRGVSAAAFRDEALFRQAVRSSIDRWFASAGEGAPDALVRQTRRFDYLEPVLAAVAGVLDDGGLRRLQMALALVFGAEAVIITRDVCRLEAGEATEVMAWAAATLLRAAMDEASAKPTGSPSVTPATTAATAPRPTSPG